MMKVLIAGFFSLVSINALAATAQYAAGPLYGGQSEPGGDLTCRIYNFTTQIVDITLKQITDNQQVTTNNFDSDSCPTHLGSTRNCAFSLHIPGRLAYSCRVYTSGTDPRISGTLEIQNSAHNILFIVPLSQMK
jgi:hypothetical protein